jgi:hypothetical protein
MRRDERRAAGFGFNGVNMEITKGSISTTQAGAISNIYGAPSKCCCRERVGMVPGVEVMLFQLSDVLGPSPRSQVAPVSAQVRVLGVCRYCTTDWLHFFRLDLLIDGIYINSCSFEYSINYFPVVIRPLLSGETLSATYSTDACTCYLMSGVFPFAGKVPATCTVT